MKAQGPTPHPPPGSPPVPPPDPSRPPPMTDPPAPIPIPRMPVQSCSLGPGGSGFLNHGRVSESTSSTANQNHAPHLAHRDLPAERRDTESAIRLWQRKASEVGDSPPLSTFDFTRLTSDWGYRFLISGDQFVDASSWLDQSQTQESRTLVTQFGATSYLEVIGEARSRNDLQHAIVSGDAQVAVEIPPDYARNLAARIFFLRRSTVEQNLHLPMV